jgi:hypothetical protein
MRKLLSIIILIITGLTFKSCAVIKTESKPVTKVIQIENAEKNKPYVKANNWMVSAFNNAESVVQFTDKESGTITGKYLLGTVTDASQYGAANRVFAIINIQVKDGASKITVTPESFQYAKGNIYTLYTEEKANSDVNALIASFEDAMVKETADDW